MAKIEIGEWGNSPGIYLYEPVHENDTDWLAWVEVPQETLDKWAKIDQDYNNMMDERRELQEQMKDNYERGLNDGT